MSMNSLAENDIRRIKPEIYKCLQNASEHLSLMIEKEVQVKDLDLSMLDVSRIPYFWW